jgi:agmatinase
MKKDRDFSALLEAHASGVAPETGAGLFGSPFNIDEANLVILGIPWDATCSYGRGSALAPKSISQVSHQLDLSDDFFGNTYRARIALDESLFEIAKSNKIAAQAAEKCASLPPKKNIVKMLMTYHLKCIKKSKRKLYRY